MAVAEKKTDELDTLAFEIFKERVASVPTGRSGEQDALESYRKAEAFLAVREKVKAGELSPAIPDGPHLADCCCPNMHRNHPLNLIAKTFTDRKGGNPIPGDLSKVNRILGWLNRNPTPETDPNQLTVRLNREFPDLGWDEPTINVARAVFPTYAVKN